MTAFLFVHGVFVTLNMSVNSKRVGLTWVALGMLIVLVRKLNGSRSSPV